MAEYYEHTVEASGGLARAAANWVTGELAAALNRHDIEIARAPVDAPALGAILRRLDDGTLSATMAKQVFEAVWNGEGDPETVIAARGLEQVTDSGALEAMVDEVLAANPDQVEQFRAGKHKVLGFLVGQVMKASAGKADPKRVNALMRERLQA